MLKAYKYRLYPNKQQEILLQKTFGCCRFVYNQTLDYRKKLYENENKNMNKFSCSKYVTQVLKKEFEWLKEVDKYALTNSVWNMDTAYQNFFVLHSGYPKFKSKRDNHKSYKTDFTNNNIGVSFEKNKVKLPKLKWIKAKLHREFVGKIKSATISQEPSGKYFISILVDEICDAMPLRVGDKIGIDLGIKDLLITSNGDKFENIHALKKYENKLIKQQQRLSRKVKGSNNRNKQRIKVARLYEKIRNIRLDYLHKITHKLISENQVIVSEDLSISKMMEEHNLAKQIQDCSWYELTRQLQYKADWNNRQYIKISRYVPSSQTCNCCGYINPEVKNLSVREWVCTECGTKHDRDINAAKNILTEGLKQLINDNKVS